MELFTIGHSSRSLEEFVGLLRQHEIDMVVDVRRFPHSRRHPQFNRETLAESLERNGIMYVWLGDLLGGFRDEGYEQYMRSEDFDEGIQRLSALTSEKVIVIMCAEKEWTQCHREHISNYLAEKGYRVCHILDDIQTYEHSSLL